MIPALTLIITAYVITRMLELLANEARDSRESRSVLQAAAVVTMLVAIGSCTAVQFSGASIPTP